MQSKRPAIAVLVFAETDPRHRNVDRGHGQVAIIQVNGITKFLAKELAQTDFRVSPIAPAAILTANLVQMTPEFVQILIGRSPLKRLGWVVEAARMVMWFSSDDCTFNPGAVIDLSGGRAAY